MYDNWRPFQLEPALGGIIGLRIPVEDLRFRAPLLIITFTQFLWMEQVGLLPTYVLPQELYDL